MEISKLTICRQDVIELSDTDTESNKGHAKKKKKQKVKTKCVRNVKLTTMIVNRIVPYCYRQRCRSGEHYHRQTSMNTKYRKRETASTEIDYEKYETPPKKISHKSSKKNSQDTLTSEEREIYSPITVASSSTDTYENVSSCSFNIMSSDSDELEDLINLTRKRMKKDNGIFTSYPVRKSAYTTTKNEYQNISSNDDILDSSIHSMDTVVLYNGGNEPYEPGSPEYLNQGHLTHNNNIDPMLLCKSPSFKSNELLKSKIPSLSCENNNNLSPMYEISGKVFMEHYLNTSFI